MRQVDRLLDLDGDLRKKRDRRKKRERPDPPQKAELHQEDVSRAHQTKKPDPTGKRLPAGQDEDVLVGAHADDQSDRHAPPDRLRHESAATAEIDVAPFPELSKGFPSR